MSHGDIYRILNGYDDCGNICGRDNDNDKDLPCKVNIISSIFQLNFILFFCYICLGRVLIDYSRDTSSSNRLRKHLCKLLIDYV